MHSTELPSLIKETEGKYGIRKLPDYITSYEEVKDETKARSCRNAGWFVVDDKAYSLPKEVPAAGIAAARWDDDEIVEYYVNHLISDFVPKEKKTLGVSYINPKSTAKAFGHENIIIRVFGKDSMSDPEIYKEKVENTDPDKLRGMLPIIWAEEHIHNPFQDVFGAKQEIKKETTPKDLYILCLHGMRENPVYRDDVILTWGKWSELVGHTDDPLFEKYKILEINPEMATKLRRDTMEVLAGPISAGTLIFVGTIATAFFAQTDLLKWGLRAGYELYKHTGVVNVIPALTYGFVAVPGVALGGISAWLVYNLIGKKGGEKISEGKIKKIEEDKKRVRMELEKNPEIYWDLADSYYRMLRVIE